MAWHMLFQEMVTILADTDRLFDICCTYIRRSSQPPINVSAAFLTEYWSILRITSTDSPSLVTLVTLLGSISRQAYALYKDILQGQ